MLFGLAELRARRLLCRRARGREQQAQDAASHILRPRGLDPTDLGIGEVRVGRNEPLKKEAQRDAQREGEDHAAEDQEIEKVPAEVEAEPHGAEEEDGGEQVGGDYRGAAVAVDGELLLPGPQAPQGLAGGAIHLLRGAHALHEEAVVGREAVELAPWLPLHHHHYGRVLQGVVAAQDLIREHALELPRIDEQTPDRLQRVQDREQNQENNEYKRHEQDQHKRHNRHLCTEDFVCALLYRRSVSGRLTPSPLLPTKRQIHLARLA